VSIQGKTEIMEEYGNNGLFGVNKTKVQVVDGTGNLFGVA